MLLPVFDFAIRKECGIQFELKENGRNLVVTNFIKNLTDKNNFLELENIYKLRKKFNLMPIKVIYNLEFNKKIKR